LTNGDRTASAEEPELSGTILGRFEVHRRLGKGGMGEVYLATDKKLKRQVALKRLARHLKEDVRHRYRRRLMAEAEGLSRLNSQHIAALYDAIDVADELLLVMEYVDGTTLRAEMTANPMPVPAMLDIAIQCAEALVVAHGRGVIHRDLKPENIMLTRAGLVKVCDFGLALRVAESDEPTVSFETDARSALRGTPGYMAPETLLGREGDARTDLFSLGVVFYELLAGGHPFRPGTGARTIDDVLKYEAPDLGTCNPQVPEPLVRLVHQMLARDPDDRPPSARRVRDELLCVPRRAEPVAVVVPRPRGRARASTVAAGAALVMALAALAPPVPPPADALAGPTIKMAVLPCEHVGRPDDEYWADGIMEAVMNDLSTFPNVRVVARSAVMRYKHRPVDPREVWREFGVDALLESTFQRAGERLRISARLIRAEDGFEMWAGRYDQPAGDIFEVQDAVAAQIARAMHVQLAPGGRPRRPDARPTDLRAYELYLQGQYYFYQYDRPSIEKAIQLYRLALTRDPDFGPAHAGLSLCYSQYSNFGWDLGPVWLDRAVESARRALAAAPEQAEGHFALAFAHHQRGEFEEALREFERTVALNPSHAHAHAEIAMIRYQSFCQLPRAIAEYDVALDLDPYLLTALWYRGYLYGLMGDFAQAEASIRKARQLNPDSEYTLMFSAALYDISGDLSRGRRAWDRMLAMAPRNPLLHWSSGLGHELAENHEAALAAYDEALRLRPDFFLAHAGRARALFHLRRHAQALAASEAALAAREDPLAACKSCQLWFSRPVAEAQHATILHAMGRTESSLREFDRLRAALAPRAANACVAYQLARAEALAGRLPESLGWLQRAVDEGCAASAIFRVEPDLKALRSSPRFAALARPGTTMAAAP
jgi:TolB-like protein/lipoprotein NlpI/tRNA A-37 threonylcarbamoyl transferase component Bud32